MAESRSYQLGIDCPPGNPRPGDLIDKVLEGTGLPTDRKTVSRSFGAWTWDFTDVPGIEEIWRTHADTIFARLERLVALGTIRGGLLDPRRAP